MSLLGKRLVRDRSESSPNGNNKEGPQKSSKRVDVNALEECAFFVEAAPVTFYSNYCRLRRLCGIVSRGYDVPMNTSSCQDSNPVTMDSLREFPLGRLREQGLLEDTRRRWKAVLEALEDPEGAKAVKERLRLAHAVLTLAEASPSSTGDAVEPGMSGAVKEEDWKQWQKSVWWVEQVETWTQGIASSTKDHVRVSMAALIAECFYRFVWSWHVALSFAAKNAMECEEGEDIVDNDLEMGEPDEMEGEDDEAGMVTEVPSSCSLSSSKNAMGSYDIADIPPVVAVFFPHASISAAFDESEEEFVQAVMDQLAEKCLTLDEAAGHEGAMAVSWSIAEPIEAFKRIALQRSAAAHRLSGVKEMDAEEINTYVIKLYLKRFVPFLHSLGIRPQPESPWEWRWHNDMPPEFLEEVYLPTFKNLTVNGEVSCSSLLLNLFPSLQMQDDARSSMRLPLICDAVEQLVEAHGVRNPQVDELVQVLDDLLEEQEQLKREGIGMEVTGASLPASLKGLQEQMEKSKTRRMEEVGCMIDSIRDELHRLTGSIDAVESGTKRQTERAPKKRKRKKKACVELLSLQSVRQMLQTAGVEKGTLLVTLGKVDIAFHILGSALFAAKPLLHSCSNSMRKIAQSRIVELKNEHLKAREMALSFCLDLEYARSKREKKVSACELGGEQLGTVVDGTVKAIVDNAITRMEEESGLDFHSLRGERTLPLVREQLEQMCRTKSEKKRVAALKKIARLIHEKEYPSLSAFLPLHALSPTSVLLGLQVLERSLIGLPDDVPLPSDVDSSTTDCEQQTRDELSPLRSDTSKKALVVMSAAQLWDICCSPKQQESLALMKKLMDSYPAQMGLLVFNQLDPREYALDIHKWIPWRLEAHCRLFEANTFALPMPGVERSNEAQGKDRESAENGGDVAMTADQVATSMESHCTNDLVAKKQEWLLKTMAHSTNKEEREALMAYEATVREYTVFYPSTRVPVVPFHYVMHGVHAVSGAEHIDDMGDEEKDEERDEERAEEGDEERDEEREKERDGMTGEEGVDEGDKASLGDSSDATAAHQHTRLYPSSQPPPTTWFYHAKQSIDHGKQYLGVTVTAMWETTRETDWELEYMLRDQWETSLSRVVESTRSLEELVHWLHYACTSGPLRRIAQSHCGWFFVTSIPSGGTLLSNMKADNAAAQLRFYTADQEEALVEATAERPSSIQLIPLIAPKSKEPVSWVTFRMDTECSEVKSKGEQIVSMERESICDGETVLLNEYVVKGREKQSKANASRVGPSIIEERKSLFKYAILGNSTFWSFISSNGVSALNLLRAAVEERLFFRPVEDIVSEAMTGPVTLEQLEEELSVAASQKYNQFRIISAVEEWCQLLGGKLTAFLNKAAISQPALLRSSGHQHPSADMAVAVLVNISLEDASNWKYWEEELHLENETNWERITCPASVPPRYRQHVTDVSILSSALQATSAASMPQSTPPQSLSSAASATTAGVAVGAVPPHYMSGVA